ncbi:MAG: hypothetical protein ABIZ04_11955 [Opitutus sp.]
MNIGRLLSRSVVALALGVVAHRSVAQGASDSLAHSFGANTRVRQETISLIRHDAEQQQRPAEVPTAAPANAEGVVVLDPFDVSGDRDVPDLSLPRENRVEKFFRTGTFRQYIGKKVTTRFWSSGADGVVLSFRW